MINFKSFPFWELLFRVCAITGIVSSFILVETLITVPKTTKDPIAEKETIISCVQEESEKARITDLIVKKLDASIELQEHLLAIQDEKDKGFLEKLESIKKYLENIEERAQAYEVATLIKQSKIDEIKGAIEIYTRSS